MIQFENIQKTLSVSSLIRCVDRFENGHVRVETGLSYPDGSAIDVFLKNDQTQFPQSMLTDFGQTTFWLVSAAIKPWASKKRLQIIEDVVRIYGARTDGGALVMDVPDEQSLATSILRLGQACIRVSDLYFTRRSGIQSPAVDEVEELLAETDLSFESGADILSKFKKPVRVDFQVHGKRTQSAIIAIGGVTSSQVQTKSVDVFKRWYDLSEWGNQKITVFDDRHDVYRDEDMKRLQDVSMLLPLSDSQTIKEAIAA